MSENGIYSTEILQIKIGDGNIKHIGEKPCN